MKSTWVDLLGLDVLDHFWLAGGLIDRIHNDAVFTALEHLLKSIAKMSPTLI